MSSSDVRHRKPCSRKRSCAVRERCVERWPPSWNQKKSNMWKQKGTSNWKLRNISETMWSKIVCVFSAFVPSMTLKGSSMTHRDHEASRSSAFNGWGLIVCCMHSSSKLSFLDTCMIIWHSPRRPFLCIPVIFILSLRLVCSPSMLQSHVPLSGIWGCNMDVLHRALEDEMSRYRSAGRRTACGMSYDHACV